MIKIRLLLCLMSIVPLLNAQKPTLTVKDQETGEPVEMALLMDESGDLMAMTNSEGQADVSSFYQANSIEVRRLGYKTINTSFTGLETIGFLLYLEPTSIHLDDVIVSASRWAQSAADVPSTVVSVSARDLTLQNPQTAADLLGISGKVFIQKSQQGGGSPMIRGFATNRLLLAVDGVRMNTAIFRSGNVQQVISLDPYAISNTEVVFGPGSVIYGSDAIGGVMGFQTLSPHFSLSDKVLLGGKALARYASANEEKTTHFDLQLGWKKWALVTSFSSNKYGDLQMGSHGPDEYLRPFYVRRIDGKDEIVTNNNPKLQVPSGYDQLNLMQKIRFNPGKDWDLQYAFHYSETSGYSRYDRHIRYRDGLPRYGEWNYGPQKWMMNVLSATNNSKNPMYDEMNLKMAWQYFEESRISRDIQKTTREIRLEKVNAYSANLDFIRYAGSKHKFFYGLEAIWDQVDSRGTDEDIGTGESWLGPSRYPQADWYSFGAYVTSQHKLNANWMLQAGIRYNQFLLDATFDTSFYPFPFTSASLNKGALTGSLGATFRPDESWVIRGNLATAFRAPNVDDVGKVFDSEPGSVTVPNPDLAAEYAYNMDIGIARVFGDWLRMDLAAYFTWLENAMVRRNFQLNGLDSIFYDGELSQVQAIQNAANARVWGIQAGLEMELGAGFSLASDFNFQRGEEELDDGTVSPSRHAAPWFGVSRINYETGPLRFQFYAQYSGAKNYDALPEEEKGKTEIYAIDEAGNPWSPGWYTLNFKAVYRFEGHIQISAGVENLTDQRYRPYSSGIAAAGRNVQFSLRFLF